MRAGGPARPGGRRCSSMVVVVGGVLVEPRIALVAGEVAQRGGLVVEQVVVVQVVCRQRVLVWVAREVVGQVAPDGGARGVVRRRLAGQQVQLLLAGALGRYVGASGCVGPIAR